MEIIQTNALISINATLVVQLVSFLLFVAIMNRLMFRPLRDVVAKRKFRMRKLKEDVSAAEDQLAGIEADLAKQKRNLRSEAQSVNAALEEATERQIVTLFEDTAQKTKVMREQAERRAAEQLQSAREQLQNEAQQLSTVIMQKILRRRLS
jgi:F-type H+-transporting ATPase subunit b